MRTYVTLLLVAIVLSACNDSKSRNAFEQKEDTVAKALLQGIWLDNETDTPLMRVKGDTIYYADSKSAPIAFHIKRDTLYTYGNDTTWYAIDKQDAQSFCFHSIDDSRILLHKSEEAGDSICFSRREVAMPVYTEVTKRDSVVHYNGIRYHAYVYINPSTMKVVKTVYSEDGISMENVYYDNVMHICVYQGKKRLYACNLTKAMLSDVVPAEILNQAILSDTRFVKVDSKGFHYRATLSIPETSIYTLVSLTVGHGGKLAIAVK